MRHSRLTRAMIAAQTAKQPPTPGVCQFCKCTEDCPCLVNDPLLGELGPCTWWDPEQTVCSNTECVYKYLGLERAS